ncbi:MAG: hypothetical protein LBG06_01790 [Deltaproteobacteria bacterium]|nr:hypothetical protein [Deltaproteobacteria bacterium]
MGETLVGQEGRQLREGPVPLRPGEPSRELPPQPRQLLGPVPELETRELEWGAVLHGEHHVPGPQPGRGLEERGGHEGHHVECPVSEHGIEYAHREPLAGSGAS